VLSPALVLSLLALPPSRLTSVSCALQVVGLTAESYIKATDGRYYVPKDKTTNTVLGVVDFICTEMKDSDFILKREKRQGRTALHLASRFSDIKLVELLLKKAGSQVGKLLTISRDDGLLPAHGAARKGRSDVLKLICESGGLEALKSEGTASCLYEALAFDGTKPGRKEAAENVARFLLGIAEDSQLKLPEDPLAERTADLKANEFVRKLIEERLTERQEERQDGPKIVPKMFQKSKGSTVGCSVMHMAAAGNFDRPEAGKEDLIHLVYRLADKHKMGGGKAMVFDKDTDGWTPLHWAIAGEKMMRDPHQGSSPFTIPNARATGLAWKLVSGPSQGRKFFNKNLAEELCKGETFPLKRTFEPAEWAQMGVMKKGIDLRADDYIQVVRPDGSVGFYKPDDNARLHTLTVLLELSGCPADLLKQEDKGGILPLHLAAASNSKELLKAIITRVDGGKAGDGDGDEFVGPEALKMLQARTKAVPADTTITWATEGMCAVMCAARAGALETLRMLCEDYQQPDDVVDADGRTPLHHACEFGHFKVLQYLYQRAAKRGVTGANLIRAVDTKGRTCLHAACGTLEATVKVEFSSVDEYDSEGENEDAITERRLNADSKRALEAESQSSAGVITIARRDSRKLLHHQSFVGTSMLNSPQLHPGHSPSARLLSAPSSLRRHSLTA
jgi:ankyrin repeat protein